MVLYKKSISNNRIINSRESTLYIDKNIIYKIFKENIDINKRIKVIEILLNNDIIGCPKIYDFVYHNLQIVGYTMQYYPNAVPFSQNMKFEFIRKKCLELIKLYLDMKNNYNLCYIDFYNENVFINNSSILLLDIDSCEIKENEKQKIADKYLCDYVLKMIYKTIFFDYEIYFSLEEREKIRKVLYKDINGQRIETIKDLEMFVQTTTKSDIKKVLKKLPYSIR